MSTQRTNSQAPTSVSPPVILKNNRPDDIQTFSEHIAKFMGLLPFGTTYLSRQARYPLRKAAWLLVLIFVFDMIAWSILFNLILHRGQFMMSWLFAGAVFLALLLSTATLIFEINIFTSDLDLRKPKALVSVVPRVLIILASAMITAQPLHILFFDGPISQRAQQEQAIKHASMITKEALGKIEKNKKYIEFEHKIYAASIPTCSTNACKLAQEDREREDKEISQIQREISEIKKEHAILLLKKKNLEVEKQTESNELGRSKRYIYSYNKKIKNELDSGEIKNLEKKRGYWRNKQKGHEKKIKELEEQIPELDALIAVKTSELHSKEGEIKHHEEVRAEYNEAYKVAAIAFEKEWEEKQQVKGGKANKMGKEMLADEALYRDFLMRILTERLSMGDTYPSDPSTESNPLRVFNFQPLDFFERLRVWEDLRHGRSAKWPEGLTEEEMKYIFENFKLQPLPTEYEAERLTAEASSHSFNHYAVLFLGLFLPMLVLLFKLLLPEALKRYYSYDFQAYRGHPEALKFRQFKRLQEEAERRHAAG